MCTVAGNGVAARNPFVVIARVVTMGITSVALPNDVAEKNDFCFFVAESNTLLLRSTDSLDELNLSRQLDHV